MTTLIERATIYPAIGNPYVVYRVRTGGVITSIHHTKESAFKAIGI